ncbi:MAG: ATP-binding protein [Bdellovibrionota bacterium]
MTNPLKNQSIRLKMFILVTAVLLGSIFAVLWKTRQIFFEDKYDFIRQLSSKLSSTSGRLAQERLNELQNKMALFVSTRESLQRVNSKDSNVLFERFGEFLTMSVQKQLPSKNWGSQWTLTNNQSNSKSDKQFTESFAETILRSISYQTLGTGQINLSRFEDPDGNPFFAVYFLADLKEEGSKGSELTSLVAFMRPTFLNDIVLEYKGDLNTVFLVDHKGYIFAHPNEELIGQSLTDHPVIRDIEGGRDTGSGQFEMKDGEDIIANYGPIAGTNLYIVVTTPEKQAFVAARDLLITVLTFGIGFLIIGSVLSFALASRITKPLNELKDITSLIGSGDFKVPVNVKSNDEVGALAANIDKMRSSLLERDEQIEHSKMALVQSEKMSAFGQLSAGIAHEVKNPLAGILGHAQLGKSKSKDPDVTKHLDMIERETRRTKEIIENLMKFARAEKPDLTSTDLHESVSRAVDLADHQVSLQGVKIVKDFRPVSPVNANSNQIQQVLLNLMMNATHAMETSKVKTLTVSVEDKNDIVQIRIKDSGAGMSPEVQKRIFEPFFTTKPAGKGTGLGLSVSIGIVQDHKGKIYVESKVGEGTTFFIDIPKMGSAAANAPATQAPQKVTPSPMVRASSASGPKFPEFSTKIENPLDSQVQRDYLKESSSSRETGRSIADLKREASEILRQESEIIQPAEAKLEQSKTEQGKLQQKIENMKKDILNTETEIKNNFNSSEKKGDDFQVSIRKPKLKA